MSAGETPKRFYKEAGIFDDAAGFGVALDGRQVKTPGGREFRVPSRALAKLCAREWAAQRDRIAPASMPLTGLAYAALDTVPARRAELAAHIAKYGETDLVCHRVDTPASLVRRQSGAWDPILAWADAGFGLRPPIVAGIIANPSAETVEGLRAHAAALDDFRLFALAQATSIAGSAMIGLALVHGLLDAAQAFAAATIDEHFSLETWGEDAEARARLAKVQQDLDTIGRFIAALA